MNKLKTTLEKVLKKQEKFIDSESKEIDYIKIKDLADKINSDLIGALAENKQLKEKFFTKIKDVYVFNVQDFKFFLDENRIDNSYTKYKNIIGLGNNNGFIKNTGDVVLNFPFKDCVLEGGQSTEEGKDSYFEFSEKSKKYEKKEGKRNEIFFNEVLAHDEIDRLFDKKALTNWKRFNKDTDNKGGEVSEIIRDSTGVINENLIIKGNNLLALHSLKSEFSGKIKLIYIDPPYNTGKDSFVYNDNFNHSTWLSFMKNRLEVSKDLLTKDGVVLVQCDDTEQAYLRILMDEIFGRQNSESVIWKKIDPKFDKNTNAKVVKRTKRIHEYIHISFIDKKNTLFGKIQKLPKWKNKYNNIDNDPRGAYKQGIISFEEGHKKEDRDSDNYYTITLPSGRKMTRHFFVLKDQFEELIKDNRIYFPKNGDGVPALKIFENEKKDFFFETILEGVGSLNSAKKEFAELFDLSVDDLPFDTLKPSLLLKEMIRAITGDGDIILDYNAGSGTTGQAVLDLNMEGEDNRKFILIEQMDYIQDVTSERIKKVMKKNKSNDSFIYFELAKWNEKAKEEIQKSKDLKSLIKLFDDLYEKYFLNYNLKIKDFKEKVIKEKEFIALSFGEQKKMFLEMLDLNQMYVQESEMSDKKYGIKEKDQKLTKEFYNKK